MTSGFPLPASGPSAVAGLVLMGGRASRMGGGDKALIAIAGRPALDRLLERFSPQVGALALSANGDPARFSAYGLPILADAPDGPEGPLAGVLSGLAWASTIPRATHLATAPGDAPCPPLDLVARLSAVAGEGAAVAEGARGVEPLHALWPLGAVSRLRTLVAEGVASPKRALELLGAGRVAFHDPLAFADLDEPADVARIEQAIRGR
ncbi:NTP transferase domain-containing protein [Hansschlegelia zhihuaiae]|uniref:Molybdenum cofactor guanylyltransferase n=1 Tax=Hansschlegelia zhihuaiae TaxID=405005 RepID=A0A4Q0MQI8_9HYPH|nr:NTP transferase domain-containing protein [Hansschlegelia zhihuaiae]RXF75386.1 molybdenum cofactor guanylyltransferase [Hansschlegelia zhihuaiae]